MLARLAILCVLQLFAYLLSANAANASCYSADPNTIGTVSPCTGMLIVDQTMLNTAVSNGSYAITGPDSNSYTFGNSARNIFTGQMTSMYGLFRDKTSFNADIGYWDVSNVTDMTNMFRGASSFNKDIGSWDVSKVIYLDSTFQDATSFNQNLNSWNVANVTNLGSAFKGATAFNGNISSWNTSKVDYIWYTFQGATSFNQNISSWDTANVSNMIYMFDGASAFNQDLTGWDVSRFASQPSGFSNNANAWALNKRPLWGIPQLSSSAPADGATGVAADTNITLTFGKNIQAGSGFIKLYKSDNTLVQSFNIASAATFLGNAVRVNPSSNLDSLQSYYVKVDATAIDDTDGNSFPGINDNTTLNFTVADVAAPTLSSSSPADNATGVAVSTNIVLTFNENVVAGSGNITLKKSSDNSTVQAMPVDGGNVTISGNTVTINPTANLDSSEGYYLQIAATALDDASGNSYAGISNATSLNFTAADIIAPTLSSSSPADNATGVASNASITLTFSENIQVGTGNIILFKADNSQVEVFNVASDVTVSGAALTLNPTLDFASNQGFYLHVAATAVDDLAGNSYAGIADATTLNFTSAADNVSPTLVSSSPADNATGVAVDANIVLTFNESVDAESGNITLFKTGGATAETIAVGSGLVSVSGNVVTINPNNLLDSAQGYYVQIAASGFDDVAGNSFAGINDATTLNFTAADVAGPTLSSSTPADDATGVAVDANIVLTFDENVVAGSGNITLKKS